MVSPEVQHSMPSPSEGGPRLPETGMDTKAPLSQVTARWGTGVGLIFQPRGGGHSWRSLGQSGQISNTWAHPGRGGSGGFCSRHSWRFLGQSSVRQIHQDVLPSVKLRSHIWGQVSFSWEHGSPSGLFLSGGFVDESRPNGST